MCTANEGDQWFGVDDRTFRPSPNGPKINLAVVRAGILPQKMLKKSGRAGIMAPPLLTSISGLTLFQLIEFFGYRQTCFILGTLDQETLQKNKNNQIFLKTKVLNPPHSGNFMK